MAGQEGPSAAIEVAMTPAYFSMMQRMRKHGVKRRRTRRCGARGDVSFLDHWQWPSSCQAYLFPNRSGKRPIHKDIVCHAITKARRSFIAPQKCILLDPGRIRQKVAKAPGLRVQVVQLMDLARSNGFHFSPMCYWQHEQLALRKGGTTGVPRTSVFQFSRFFPQKSQLKVFFNPANSAKKLWNGPWRTPIGGTALLGC